MVYPRCEGSRFNKLVFCAVVSKAPIDKDLLSLWKQSILKDGSQKDLPFILLLNRFQDHKAGWPMETDKSTEHNDCRYITMSMS